MGQHSWRDLANVIQQQAQYYESCIPVSTGGDRHKCSSSDSQLLATWPGSQSRTVTGVMTVCNHAARLPVT